MHNYIVSQSVTDRVLRRQGKLVSHDTIDAARAALLVIDMQNYFVAEGFPAEVPLARAIVPNINRIARAMRDAGGLVVWIQTTSKGALESWANHHTYMLTPERALKRLAGLDETSDGYKLFPALEPLPIDLRVKKIKYSAFIAGSSDLDMELKRHGIDSLLVTGTLTNVCCESTARDAMMLDYRVVMLSDGNASLTDEEHTASLNNFLMFFGDVMSTDEAIGRLAPLAQRKTV
jgi:ureidoacrylate peracid hydrolase